MGRMVAAEVLRSDRFALVGANERAGHAAIGKNVAALVGNSGLDDSGTKHAPAGNAERGIIVTQGNAALLSADAVIDFTLPEYGIDLARQCAQSQTTLIIGTTGWGKKDAAALPAYGQHTVIVCAPNMSFGIALLRQFAKQAAAILGPDFDAEISEFHHRGKRDAPSGTALSLATALGRDMNPTDARPRTGVRNRGDIGFAVMRGGDVIGDHSVIFAGDGERLELTHRANDRRIYALGALRAAGWAQGQKPGFYTMEDVLGLK